MFPYRTLLILGAGASRPYLFPTASELTSLILERDENQQLLGNMGFHTTAFKVGDTLHGPNPANIFLQYRHWLRCCLEQHGADMEEVEQFQQRFQLSQSFSVDAFVADNPAYKPLASLMIAAILLKCEQEKRLQGDWYQLLFNELIDEHAQDFPTDTLSVITFNYDRSLEMYLYRSFQYRYGITPARAWELVRRIEIIHVFGSLGPLFNDDGSRQIGYGSGAIGAASKQLRLVDPRSRSENATVIRALIDRSPRIVILGFGFDRLNLAQIQIPPSGNRKVFASCFGLSSTAMARAEPGFNAGIDTGRWIVWGERNHNAADFLHNSLALA